MASSELPLGGVPATAPRPTPKAPGAMPRPITARHGGLGDRVFAAAVAAKAFAIVALVLLLVAGLLKDARPALAQYGPAFVWSTSWNPVTKVFGVLPAIYGTVATSLVAMLIAVPVGLGAGIFLAEYGSPRTCELVRLVADVLAGLPSIVIGIFGYTLLVRPMGTFSAIAGAFALGVIMLPIVARTTEESLRLVPRDLQEAALALDAPRWRAILRVVLPCAMAGVMTGVMLAVARIAGETAPLIFTALGNRFWNDGLTSPIAALTLNIFQYAISPYDQWHQQAWAASFFLLAFVLTLNVGARLIARRYAFR